VLPRLPTQNGATGGSHKMLIKLKCPKCDEEFVDDNKYIYTCSKGHPSCEMERSLIENEVPQNLKVSKD